MMFRIWHIVIVIMLSACMTTPIYIPDMAVADSLIEKNAYDTALLLVNKMLANTTNDRAKAGLLFRYGLCMENTGQTDSSIAYYSQAADLFETQANRGYLATTLLSLGLAYTSKRNFGEALRSFSNGLNWSNQNDSIDFYNAMCVVYINQEYYDSAYFIIRDSLSRYRQLIATDRSYYLFLGQGLYYNSTKRYDSALLFLNTALKISPADAYKANTYTVIANVYKFKRDFSIALQYLDSAKILYHDELGWEANKQYDYDTYREIYDSIGDIPQAYHYAKLHQKISDSIYNADNKEAMIGANGYARTIKARTTALKAEAEKERAKAANVFIVIALGLVVLLAFVAFRNVSIKQKANLILTQQKQQVQELADQLAVANDTKARLFSTIGHDLRSPVSSLYASLKMQELKGNAGGGEMSEQTVRLLDTLEELLIWSKSQMNGFKVQPVKINVWYFFEDLKEFYITAAEGKNISIVNDTAKDVVIRADENLLKTIFRNAISNAIANTYPGHSIQLIAQPATDGKLCIAVNNPCDAESFQKFNASFNDAIVKSGAYGLGIVLMKEFANKMGAEITLTYFEGTAAVKLCM